MIENVSALPSTSLPRKTRSTPLSSLSTTESPMATGGSLTARTVRVTVAGGEVREPSFTPNVN